MGALAVVEQLHVWLRDSIPCAWPVVNDKPVAELAGFNTEVQQGLVEGIQAWAEHGTLTADNRCGVGDPRRERRNAVLGSRWRWVMCGVGCLAME